MTLNQNTYAVRVAAMDAALRLHAANAAGKSAPNRAPRAADVVANAKVFLGFIETGQ